MLLFRLLYLLRGTANTSINLLLRLLLIAISGSRVLLGMGSELIPMAPVATKV